MIGLIALALANVKVALADSANIRYWYSKDDCESESGTLATEHFRDGCWDAAGGPGSKKVMLCSGSSYVEREYDEANCAGTFHDSSPLNTNQCFPSHGQGGVELWGKSTCTASRLRLYASDVPSLSPGTGSSMRIAVLTSCAAMSLVFIIGAVLWYRKTRCVRVAVASEPLTDAQNMLDGME